MAVFIVMLNEHSSFPRESDDEALERWLDLQAVLAHERSKQFFRTRGRSSQLLAAIDDPTLSDEERALLFEES